MFRLLPVLAILLLLPFQEHADANSLNVSIEVHGPSGVETYAEIPWNSELTVLRAMQSAEGLAFRADWYFSLNDWFIIQISGVDNEGIDKPNWGYCVNGFPAAVGVSAYRVPAKGTIKWVFGADYPIKC